jgi:hypothetical protein
MTITPELTTITRILDQLLNQLDQEHADRIRRDILGGLEGRSPQELAGIVAEIKAAAGK